MLHFIESACYTDIVAAVDECARKAEKDDKQAELIIAKACESNAPPAIAYDAVQDCTN